MSICSLQTYDKASAAKLSNYPVRNQSFFHSPLRYVLPLLLLISRNVSQKHRPSGRLPGVIIRGHRLFQKAPYLLCSRNLQIEGNSPLSFSKNQPPSAATPYPASPDFPLFRGQNNPLYDSPIPIGLRQQKSSPEGLLFSLEKLLIRPILLHGRAQAF